MITNKLFNENRRIKMNNFIKGRKNNGRLNKKYVTSLEKSWIQT